jgi:hypothetical protein
VDALPVRPTVSTRPAKVVKIQLPRSVERGDTNRGERRLKLEMSLRVRRRRFSTLIVTFESGAL